MPSGLVGVIRIFPYTKWPMLPAGWLACDGSTQEISKYPALFNVIGVTYGGDGTSNFSLPELIDCVPVGTGPGYGLGQMGGDLFLNLNADHLPPHTHALTGMRASAMVSSAEGQQPYPSSGMTTLGAFADPQLAAVNDAYNSETPTVPLNAGPAFSAGVGSAGGSGYVIPIQPCIKMKFAICAE